MLHEAPTETLSALVASHRNDILFSDPAVCQAAIEQLLDLPDLSMGAPPHSAETSILDQVASILNPGSYIPFLNTSERYYGAITGDYIFRQRGSGKTVGENFSASRQLKEFVQGCGQGLFQSTNPAQSLSFWQELVDLATRSFGARRRTYVLAVCAAAARSKQRGAESAGGWQDLGSLCSHIRYSRTKTSDTAWWSSQLSLVSGDRLATWGAMVSLLALCSYETIRNLEAPISAFLNSLSIREWSNFVSSLASLKGCFQGKQFRLVVVVRSVVDAIYETLKAGTPRWEKYLPTLKNAVINGGVFWSGTGDIKVPEDVAKSVLKAEGEYPAWLVEASQNSLNGIVGAKSRKVGEVAKVEKWFSY